MVTTTGSKFHLVTFCAQNYKILGNPLGGIFWIQYRGIAIKNPPLTPDLARFSIWPGWFLFRLPDSQIWTKVVLISSAEILGHLIPKNARFCRFCTVKRSKSAQIFLARFARQYFFRRVLLATFSNLKRCFLFRLPNFQIGARVLLT